MKQNIKHKHDTLVGGDAVRTATLCRRRREATEEMPSGQKEMSSVVRLESCSDGARVVVLGGFRSVVGFAPSSVTEISEETP